MSKSHILATVERMFIKQSRLIRNMVSRGVLTLIDDERKMQSVQFKALDGEVTDNAERAQNYGFSSHPLPGAETIVVYVGGDRSHPVIVVADDRSCRQAGVESGEVKVYHHQGDYIHLKNDNHIEVSTKHLLVKAEEDVTVETKNYTVNTQTYEVNASQEIAMTAKETGIHTDALDFTNRHGDEVEASFRGGLKATEDVKANDGAVSLRGHTHPGIEAGDSTTDIPVGGSK